MKVKDGTDGDSISPCSTKYTPSGLPASAGTRLVTDQASVGVYLLGQNWYRRTCNEPKPQHEGRSSLTTAKSIKANDGTYGELKLAA